MAAPSKKVQQMRQARDRRSRIILAVLGVVFVGVVVLQGPKILKKLHGNSAASPPVATSTTPSTTPSAPATSVVSRLADTAVHTSPGVGQLASFTLFSSKDPFAQQLNPDATSNTSTTPAPSTSPPPPSPPVSSAPPVVVQMGGNGGVTRVAAGVVIAMNGVRERVLVGDGFPSGDPIFKLVSFKKGLARIGLASGTFKDGTKTLVLARGKQVVLRDVTTGVTFKLRLVSWSTAS